MHKNYVKSEGYKINSVDDFQLKIGYSGGKERKKKRKSTGFGMGKLVYCLKISNSSKNISFKLNI